MLALPEVPNAPTLVQAPPVDDIINGPIRDVFLKHAAHLTFCLYLQHRHHTISSKEAIVKVGGTAHLMNSEVIRNIVSLGNKVVPVTWMTSGDDVLPMEFTVVPVTCVIFVSFSWLTPLDTLTRATTPVPTPSFLSDFLSILTQNGVEGMFGIDTMASGAWSEMSIGDASVVVPSNEDDDCDRVDFIPVAFAFDEEKPKFRVHGKCTEKSHRGGGGSRSVHWGHQLLWCLVICQFFYFFLKA